MSCSGPALPRPPGLRILPGSAIVGAGMYPPELKEGDMRGGVEVFERLLLIDEAEEAEVPGSGIGLVTAGAELN